MSDKQTYLDYSAGHEPHFQSQVYDENGKTVAVFYDDKDARNASEVVRRYNAYHDLMGALELIMADTDGSLHSMLARDRAYSTARNAIRKAEGGEA